MGWRLKKDSGTLTSAAAGENTRRPSLTATLAGGGISIFEVVERGAEQQVYCVVRSPRAIDHDLVGITVFSACSSNDCSGERCQPSPKRSLQ